MDELGEHYVVICHDIESDDISGVFATFEQAAYHLAWYAGAWSYDIERWAGVERDTILNYYEYKRGLR